MIFFFKRLTVGKNLIFRLISSFLCYKILFGPIKVLFSVHQRDFANLLWYKFDHFFGFSSTPWRKKYNVKFVWLPSRKTKKRIFLLMKDNYVHPLSCAHDHCAHQLFFPPSAKQAKNDPFHSFSFYTKTNKTSAINIIKKTTTKQRIIFIIHTYTQSNCFTYYQAKFHPHEYSIVQTYY